MYLSASYHGVLSVSSEYWKMYVIVHIFWKMTFLPISYTCAWEISRHLKLVIWWQALFYPFCTTWLARMHNTYHRNFRMKPNKPFCCAVIQRLQDIKEHPVLVIFSQFSITFGILTNIVEATGLLTPQTRWNPHKEARCDYTQHFITIWRVLGQL